MISIKNTIPALLTTFFLITATSPAHADLYIRFNSSGTGYSSSYDNWRYNHKPSIRYYKRPSGYSSDRFYRYRYPDKYQQKYTNRVSPGNRLYGYYPSDSLYGYRFQTSPLGYDRIGHVYKRGYEHGFMDGRNIRHHDELGRSGSMARKR